MYPDQFVSENDNFIKSSALQINPPCIIYRNTDFLPNTEIRKNIHQNILVVYIRRSEKYLWPDFIKLHPHLYIGS